MNNNNTIIVIEKEEVIANTLRDIFDSLESENHIKVRHFNNAEEALGWFGNGDDQTSLIIIDYDLENINIADILKRFRIRNFLVDIIVAKNSINIDDTVVFGRHGANNYIEKPIDKVKLSNMCQAYIGQQDFLKKLDQWNRWDKVISSYL